MLIIVKSGNFNLRLPVPLYVLKSRFTANLIEKKTREKVRNNKTDVTDVTEKILTEKKGADNKVFGIEKSFFTKNFNASYTDCAENDVIYSAEYPTSQKIENVEARNTGEAEICGDNKSASLDSKISRAAYHILKAYKAAHGSFNLIEVFCADGDKVIVKV